ncbi:hypothetical protein [Desulfosporosinus sp. SB140]
MGIGQNFNRVVSRGTSLMAALGFNVFPSRKRTGWMQRGVRFFGIKNWR